MLEEKFKENQKEERAVRFVVFWIALFSIVPLAVWHAFVITKLWGWLVAPVFGLPFLTKLQAYGLSLFHTYMTHKPDPFSYHSPMAPLIKIVYAIISGCVVLGIGYIVTIL
jgi:small-conductance mechanosensitive channel